MTTDRPTPRLDERGSALLLVLILISAVVAVAAGGIAMAGNSTQITAAARGDSDLQATAISGLSVGQALINADPTLVPMSGGPVRLEDRAPVRDAANKVVPGLFRTSYITRTTSGSQDNMWRLVSVAENARGDRMVRYSDIAQQSFAQFAYFTNVEGNIWFGGGDIVRGPLHSNDRLNIHQTGATFVGPVTTASTVFQAQYGNFMQGYQTNQLRIELPTQRAITDLRSLTASGVTRFTGLHNSGTASEVSARIEFVAVNLNGHIPGATPDVHGYARVYRLTHSNQRTRAWLTAHAPPGDGGFLSTANPGMNQNCGVWTSPSNFHAVRRNDVPAGARCYLGGDPRLDRMDARMREEPQSRLPGNSQNEPGEWVEWDGPINPRLVANVGADSAEFLIPITDRASHPDFNNVFLFEGRVAVSGELRGRVTVAATGNIVIVDDITYVTPPGGQAACQRERDMLGLWSGGDIIVADNMINTPQNPQASGSPPAGAWPNYEMPAEPHSGDETIHAVLLAHGTFTAENFQGGPTAGRRCDGVTVGRGCLRITGGIIQGPRGGVGSTSGSGYMKRYAYDTCAGVWPPPYFPSTGRYTRSGLYEFDPAKDVGELLRD